MGLLRDLVTARDLVVEVTAGMRQLGSEMSRISSGVLSPGGAPFGPIPNGPGGVAGGVTAPSGLQPFAQAGTLLGPNGQAVSVFSLGGPSGVIRSGAGGGGGRGGRLVGTIGGSVSGTMSGGNGGGGGGTTLAGTINPGILNKSLKDSVASPVVTSLVEIRDELRAIRRAQQGELTSLRASGVA